MRITSFFNKLIAFSLVLCFVLALGTFTAFAEPEDGIPFDPNDLASSEEDSISNPLDILYTDPGEDADHGDPNQNEPRENPHDEPEEEPPTEAAAEQPEDDYLGGWPDATSAYEEPPHLKELPAAEPGEVPAATSVVVPEVAVSDASVFAGIVMWLCVALGIAVIVGVLVSKRTRRRGA